MNEVDINRTIKDSKIDTNLISDWHHTFGELYKHRIHLFIALCKTIKNWDDVFNVIKARLHHDWEWYKGWFIVQMETPEGQISYHFPDEYWDTCSFMETQVTANEFDWHTSDDVLERLLLI